MKPQQQNTEAQESSNVYVQKPGGEEINIPAGKTTGKGLPDDNGSGAQTADETPTTHSNEVQSGEAG